MGWTVHCTECELQSYASNIVELLDSHTDKNGWFVCPSGHQGFVEKTFSLQEEGETWDPYLRGALRLSKKDNTYQPFVFFVSYEPAGEITAIWFSYYKDLRQYGGRLKMGYGPGGPPVLSTEQVLFLVKEMKSLGLTK